MRHFKHHRRNAQAALKARMGLIGIKDLTSHQATMFAHLTVAELEELSLLGRHELA